MSHFWGQTVDPQIHPTCQTQWNVTRGGRLQPGSLDPAFPAWFCTIWSPAAHFSRPWTPQPKQKSVPINWQLKWRPHAAVAQCIHCAAVAKGLMLKWELIPYEHELECQSSAPALMICTVSLWKSSHACSDGAKVLVRDSIVTNRFNAPHFAARPALACVNLTVFRTVLLCGSGSFVGLTVVCVFAACCIQ